MGVDTGGKFRVFDELEFSNSRNNGILRNQSLAQSNDGDTQHKLRMQSVLFESLREPKF